VPGTLNNLQAGIWNSGNEGSLMFRRKLEIVPAGDDQGGHADFAQPVHHRPALEQMAEAEDERLGPGSHAQRHDEFVWYLGRAEMTVVSAGKLPSGRNHFVGRNLSIKKAFGRPHRCRIVATFRQKFRRILLHPTSIAACVQQQKVRQALRVTERKLQGDHAAKGVSQYRPAAVAQRPAQRFGIGRQVFPGHGGDGCAV
jgi:hypothetical protein